VGCSDLFEPCNYPTINVGEVGEALRHGCPVSLKMPIRKDDPTEPIQNHSGIICSPSPKGAATVSSLSWWMLWLDRQIDNLVAVGVVVDAVVNHSVDIHVSEVSI
jgi:hypothetical protein